MSWKKIILLIIVIVPVGFLMFGGFLYFTDNMNLSFMKKPSEEKKIEITQMTPTPTKAEVNKDEFVIEVQNGSGISGEGAKVKEMLEDAGFTVGLVGNADTADYEDTVIKVNDEVSEAFTDELTKTLEKRGSVAKVEKLATGEDGQVIVIVGGNVKETSETPTPTP